MFHWSPVWLAGCADVGLTICTDVGLTIWAMLRRKCHENCTFTGQLAVCLFAFVCAPQIARADWPHYGPPCTDLQQHMWKQHRRRTNKQTRSPCPWSLSNLFAYCSVPMAGYYSICSRLCAHGKLLLYLSVHGSEPIGFQCFVSLLMALCPWQDISLSLCSWQ